MCLELTAPWDSARSRPPFYDVPRSIKDKGMFIIYIQYYGDARSQVISNHGSIYLNKIDKKLVVSSSLQTTNVDIWNHKFISK